MKDAQILITKIAALSENQTLNKSNPIKNKLKNKICLSSRYPSKRTEEIQGTHQAL